MKIWKDQKSKADSAAYHKYQEFEIHKYQEFEIHKYQEFEMHKYQEFDINIQCWKKSPLKVKSSLEIKVNIVLKKNFSWPEGILHYIS